MVLPGDTIDAPAADHDIPLDDIRRAAARIAGRVARTPLLSSRTAARVVGERSGVTLGDGQAADGQPRLWIKAEHLQVTGSFKARGATNRLTALTAEARRRGVITMSAGNHAMAMAYAGAADGVPVTVVMPEMASRAKVAAAIGYGAEVILHGAHVGETWTRLQELAAERGLLYVAPFDDPLVIAGQGTVGLEILDDLPDVDVVVVGIGGGGLIAGVAAALRQLRPEVRVYGVEPVESNAMSLALGAGRPVPLQPRSIADGLGAPFAGEWTLPLVQRFVDDVILIDEATIASGMRFALERLKQLIEPAGAAALGALLAGRIPLRDGDVVCAIASGGNVDLTRLAEFLALASTP